MNKVDAYVGARLREKRFQARLTIAALASRIGAGAHQLLLYENGQARAPAQILIALCRELKMSVSDLFDATPESDGDRLLRFPLARADRGWRGPHWRAAANPCETPERSGEILMLQDALVARQARILKKLECDGCPDLARLGRESLALFLQTQALLTRRAERIATGMTEEPPVEDSTT